MTLDEALHESVNKRCYEPAPRKFEGSRLPRYVRHRFPIKGGISWAQVFRRQIMEKKTSLFEVFGVVRRV